MSKDKNGHAPDSLKYQWRLLGLVLRADWATSLDKSIAYEIIDNYKKDYRNSRASLRYLEKATGAARPNVIASTRRIIENGPFSIALQGGGKRATAYKLHFDKVAENPSGNAGDTSSNSDTSGNAGDTTSGNAGDTSTARRGNAGDTESVLLVPAYKADVLDRMNDTRPPTAPDAAGLSPASPGTAVEERATVPSSQADRSPAEPTFESLWRAYAHAKGKPEARAAWNALPADTNLAAVIDAAKAWQASWAAQSKPDAPRYTLARWLKDERYDEDAPTGYQQKERPAKAKPAKPAKATGQAKRTTARITSADVVTTGGVTELRVETTDGDGAVLDYIMALEHDDSQKQEDGQRLLARLVAAAGLNQIEDSAELLGRTIILTGNKDEFAAPTNRPDDEPPLPEKPEPVVYANPPPSKPMTESEIEAVRAKVAALPPLAPLANEWQRRKEAQWQREAERDEWDAAHPELFEDKPIEDAA